MRQKGELLMATVEMYTSKRCPYCIKAKRLVDSKGVTYREPVTDGRLEVAEEAVERSGGKKTVPRIFIGDYHVGGATNYTH
jgi:glutaredoxin 3